MFYLSPLGANSSHCLQQLWAGAGVGAADLGTGSGEVQEPELRPHHSDRGLHGGNRESSAVLHI